MIRFYYKKVVPLIYLFKAMGKLSFSLVTTAAGSVEKLIVKILSHGVNQTMSEVKSLAEAAGIALEVAFDMIKSLVFAPMLEF